MAKMIAGIDEEELARREAELAAREAELAAKEAEETAAEETAKAQAAAQEETEKAQAAAQEANVQAQRATVDAAKKAQEQGFNRTVQEKIHGIEVNLLEAGEINNEHLTPDTLAHLNEQNRKGKLGYGSSWGAINVVSPDYSTIKDNEQAVFYGTLVHEEDRLQYFKEYAKASGQNLDDVLAYADDRLGTRIFATPQSNAGKRNQMYDAIDKIGLFDINGDDVNIGTADFDTVVQALSNIADAGKAKKAAAYVESLTKIPGSPYYGMTFDKDAVSYRDSANLPSKLYKEEVEDLAGSFYLGDDAYEGNMQTYLAKYEVLQENYGGDKFAFRQMERALKDAYEKQTGYKAPDSAKVQEIIEQTKAEREAQALLDGGESDKRWWEKIWDKGKEAYHSIFPGDKKEEEAEVAPVEMSDASEETKPYAMRSGYIASAGPMSSGLMAENNYIKDTVEAAVPQEEAPAPEAEEPPEMQGPAYQQQPVDKAEVAQNQPPMTYMQAMAAHNRGEDLSPENKALIADSIKNDDFMRYVVSGTTPDPKQIMQERAYGGTMLSDAQARIRANQTTTGRQILGTQLGAVAEALGTGAMPEDVVGAGYQLMVDVMNGVSQQIRSGRIAVPAGENKYDYVIANTPHLKKKAEQLSALQKDVEGIMATRAIEAAHDYDKKVEDAEIRYLKGIATQEDLMMLHSRANPDADINDDETRMQFLHQLSGRSMWYQDDGAFWKGDSAAAQAGMRLRETRADGQYGDFKSALWDKAHDVIDELTYIAMDHGMTLGGWMEKVGLNIDDPRDIMDMAYNRIEAEGAKVAGDHEAQQAVDALANVQTQGVGWLGARWGGFKHGLADDAYHFMNAGYLLMDEATYEARRNEIYNECVSEYGHDLAPKVRRQILIAYANSDAMGKEKSQELLEDIERCDSIWDIPVDVDPGMIEGLYLSGLNEIDKYVEELESVRELLPDNEAKAWDRYFGHGTNLGAGARQVVTQGLAMAAGVPYPVAKNIGLVFGHGFSSFSRGTQKYEEAGLPGVAAMYMGGAEAFGMIMVNALGDDTVMSSLNGRSLMRNGMETAFRKGSWVGLAKEAAKKTLVSSGTEAVQEVLEEGTSKTVELFTPTAKALSNGEQVSFSKSLQIAWDELGNMDGKTLYKDLLQAGWGGVVYGGFYAAVGMAFETPRSVANAKLQEKYPSIDIASQIAHGEIPANEENMGRFIDLMREDVQKPEFRALMDKKNDSAEQANYVTVAAVLGEGKEFRDKAIKLTQTANQYDQKAEAAEKAVEINRSQFYTARKAAMDGNPGAAVTLEGFRTAWAKAQTTATESRQAAQKKREEAAAETGRWIYACRKLGDNMYNLTKVRAGNLLMYKEQEAQADEMEPELAEAEANVEAMGVEEFIEQNYNNASDADKDHIREIWGVPVNTEKEEEPAAATVSETETVAENATEQEAPVAESETSEQTEQVEQTAEPAASETAQNEPDAATAPQTPSEALAEPVAQTTAEPAVEPVQSEQPAAAAPEAHAKPVQTMTGEQRLEANRKRRIDSATKFLGQVGRRFNVKTELAPADDKRLMLPKLGKDGKPMYASALYNRDTDTIIVSENASQGDILRAKVVHELTHRTENTDAYKEFSKAVQAAYFKGNEQNRKAFERNLRTLYARNGVNLSPEGLEHEVVSRITEELIGGNQEMVDRLVADSPSVARRIMDAIKGVLDKLRGVKGADVDQLRAVEKMFQKALDEAATQKRSFSSDNIQYSLREKEPPKNVVYAYKAFYARDGKLYPPMVANITDEADKQKVKGATSGTMKSLPTPVGVWLDADIGGIMTDESGAPVRSKDTKRLRVKNDKSGGGATLAFRPGWHLGEWPDAKQFNKADPETGERGKRMPDDLVFAKCEVSADVDYQLDALSYGLNNKGGFSRSQAGLPYVPDDGYYKYRTNVDPTTAPWLIAGSIKVVEILDDADCARICAEFGVTPDQRYSGKPIDLSEYGLKRGPVEATTEGMEQFKENDANRANKKLLENALNDPEFADAYVQREIDFDNPKQYEQLQKEFAMNGQDIEAYRKKYETEGFASSGMAKVDAVSNETGEPLTGTLRGGTEVQYSLSSWTPEEQNTVRSNLINKGFDEDNIDDWIDNVNSIAAIVAADRDRLDFEAADNQVMLKPNAEYVRTLDASTLCAKRLLYQGTFNAIQHRMPNKVMTSDDLIRLRNMMAEAGYETPCGICYVESRRRNLGTFAEKWLKGYDAKGGYQPKLDDVTTTDGLERMRIEHPEVYDSFVNEMKRKGSNNPKVVQLRTDYRGDIRKLSKGDIDKIIKIGGLRVQSFSDFETPHMLDMMQAVLDMTENNLTSQAYTKVPNFAWVFGDTGIKINLSLIAEGDGFDADGNLAFSSYEGMDFDEAMRLRDRYSKNVGTILVGLSDKHIRAAMADPRIDFIIPFHKSGWGKRQLSQLSGMSGYMDYTRDQNERRVIGQTKTGKPKTKNVEENFHPVDYWDYNLTGNQNAETYLRMCEEDGRIPKFSRFLSKDAGGHWVAPDGYWKLLIDFKMYDNDGVGAPQMPVRPNFNMVEARRILDEYKGGADTLPVANDIVERFVAEKSGTGNVQYAIELDESNWPIVKADRDFALSDNQKDWGKQINAYIRDVIREKGQMVIKTLDGDEIILDAKSQRKAKDWMMNGDENDNRVRKNASAHLDEVVAVSEDVDPNAPNAPDEKGQHEWAKDGWRYREAVFEDYNGKRYLLTLSVGMDGDNRTVYNIGDVKEIEKRTVTSVSGQTGRVPGSPARASDSSALPRLGSSANIITEESDAGNRQFSLPDDDFLRSEIDAWRSNPNYSVDDNTGKRQFANKTIQENTYVPDHIKQAFLNDPAKANYSKESNAKQLSDAYNRVQKEGFNGVKNRLLAQDTTFTTEDNADALVLMSQSLYDNDLDTFMSIASKYNTEGTDQAKALQIRSLMKTMTPTGFAQKVIKDASQKMDEHLKSHNRESKKIARKVKNIDENLGLRNLDGRSSIQKLVEAGESIKVDNKFGVPLNDRQRVLIKQFGLEKVRHPGMFYNWASTKQRMLMDILTTDDVYAEDYNGFNLVERLIRMEAGQPVVTKADITYITENMDLFNSYADRNSREADIALSRAYEAYGNINPATGKMKRRTWRYTSMLLSVPSAIRNVIGNAAQSVPNAIADGVAVELDRLFSAITGEDRTRAHININDRIDGWSAFRDETFNTFRDYFIDKTVTQYGEGRYNENQRGRVFENQFGETLRRMEGLLMSVGDRNFWKKKFFNSLAEQQHLAEINGTEFNLEQAMETAEAEANYATFNEDNAVRSLFTKMKDIPAIGTVLDHIMPFTGVPTNIIKRQIEFSPIGIAATAWKHGLNAIKGGDFDQRAFVDGMARGLTGSALMGIGAILLKEGILKLGTKEEEDDKSYGVRTAQGDQYGVYFTIGDKNYSISTFSPAASALVAGAFVADALENNEAWYQAIVNGTLKNVNEIFDASYMSSLADLLNTSNGGNIVDNAVPTVLNSMLTQNIPAPITHLASAMDPYVRDTKDKDAIMEVVKTTMSKIPGARELLPEKVDVAGRAVENTKYGAAAFVDPFTTSYVNDDPALNEMIRLRDVLTEKGYSEPRAHMASDALSGRRNTLSQNKVSYTVTPEEKEAYRKLYGDLWRNGGITYDKKGKRVRITQGVEELIRSRAYQLMTPEEQAEEIKKILQKAKEGATYQIMNHK